ncbi:terminase small subunit (plasmid) [Herbaspirillum seropedicae]|uniref:terminase small subunit n=1 Tax=Herbaspirillum seropedicae TaxID=964 RepID=UPI001122F62A|nr:terminase small subunit [Herbaspirillum seropedicae]QDD62658.1 terminase small subunit [Herbaspirillum seropedicae]
MQITPKIRRFVEEYLVDLNGTKAAVRAGYSAKTAKVQASQMLAKPEIKALVEEAKTALSERTQISTSMVLSRLWQQATADPNEIVQYVRECCRYCYGKDHQYQWTKGEYQRKQEEAREAKKETPSCAGGFGFNPKRPPRKDCPECFGDGHGRLLVSDTRNLSPAALAIYAGVKRGKDGLEAKLLDQQVALRQVGEHIGMFNKRVELSAPGGGPIQQRTVTTTMTPEQFQEIARTLMNEY